MYAKFGIERELQNKLQLIEYQNGNGDFHFHSQIELCIVNDGEIDALVNNKRKTLRQGEISVALSYDTHVYIPLTEANFSVLIIPLHICEKFISAVSHKKISNPFICNSEQAGKIKAYIDAFKKADNEIMSIGYVYLILGIITENLSFEMSAEADETGLLSGLLLYIHENYNKDLTLSSLSRACGYNPSYISRYFKSHIGIGITQYINIVRLRHATQLMQEKKHSISYCALESGFNSLRTFYRIFHNEFHCSPKEYFTNI